MELRQLRCVVAVAEDLHFGRAAQRLHVTPSALSQQVARLERELGVLLFDRSPRRVRLTAAGRAFVEESRQILTDVEHAVAAARAATADDVGHLVVGFTSHGAGELTTALLEQFSRQAPGVGVELRELDFAEHFTALADRVVDVQFVRMPFDPPAGARVAVLSAEPRVAAVGRRHRLSAGEGALTPAQLRQETFFRLPDAVPDAWRRHFAPWGTRPDSPRIATVTEALGLTAAGRGVVLLPRSLARLLPRPDIVYRRAQVDPSKLAVAWRCLHASVGQPASTSPAHPSRGPVAPCSPADAFVATAVDLAAAVRIRPSHGA